MDDLNILHEFRYQQKLSVFPIINDLGEQILPGS